MTYNSSSRADPATPSSELRRVVISEGRSIAVHDYGGNGPNLLLLHANGFHGRVFAPMVSYLVESFRCLAPDLRGHGESCGAWCPSTSVPSSLVSDLQSVLESLGLHRCSVFGHSLGGMLALMLAQRCKAPPLSSSSLFCTVDFVYCFEPIVIAPQMRESMKSVTEMLARGADRRKREFESEGTAWKQLSAQRPYSSFHPAALRGFLQHGLRPFSSSSSSANTATSTTATGAGMQLCCSPEVEASLFRGTFRCAEEVWDTLDRCPASWTVISASAMAPEERRPSGGAADAAASSSSSSPHAALPRCAALLVERLGRGSEAAAEASTCRLKSFEGCDHFGPVSSPEMVAEHVKAEYRLAADGRQCPPHGPTHGTSRL